MNQDSIHTVLKTEMLKAGFLSDKSASVEGWTAEHQAVWNSYAYHKLGLSNHLMVPNNKEALIAIGIRFEFVEPQEATRRDVEDQEFEEKTETNKVLSASKVSDGNEFSFTVNLNADSDQAS